MKAGYAGKDAMRENAEKAFGKSLKAVTEPAKASASRPENLKPRLYKNGGSVKTTKSTKYNLGGVAGGSSAMNTGLKKGGIHST